VHLGTKRNYLKQSEATNMDYSKRLCRGLCQKLDGVCMGLCSTDESYVQTVYDRQKFEHIKKKLHWEDIPELEKNSVVSTEKLEKLKLQIQRKMQQRNNFKNQ
jgi:hypothetical protein